MILCTILYFHDYIYILCTITILFTSHNFLCKRKIKIIESTYIFCKGHTGIVSTTDRIRRRYHCASGVKRRNDTGLRNRNTLLLHSFVNRCSVLIIHLEKTDYIMIASNNYSN